MGDHYFLNEDHSYKPCSLMEWAEQHETMERHVGNDIIDGKYVSTVWLGLNHRFFEKGPPLVFETMVFDAPKGGSDIYMVRYSTWDEAEKGHAMAIQWVLDGCKDED